MTATVVPAAQPTLEGAAQDEVTARLLAAITTQFAATVRWTPEGGVVTFPQDHPTLGWKMCVIAGCGKACTMASGLCQGCWCRWKRQGKPPIEEFTAQPKSYLRTPGVQPCTVPGCQRPWKTKRVPLCQAHEVQRRVLLGGISLEAFRSHPDVVPHLSLGPCLAASCTRERAGRGAYCVAHYDRWRKAQRRQPGLDEGWWRRTAPVIADDNQVSLRACRCGWRPSSSTGCSSAATPASRPGSTWSGR
jgi:hypothetical protein